MNAPLLAAAEGGEATRAHLRAWLRLLRTVRAIEAELRERIRRETGWSLPRFDVMAALDRAPGGLRMSELGRALVISNGNVTALVDGLVADGLALRVPDPGDRRAWRVQMTEAGRAAFAEVARAHGAWIDALFAGLDAAETETLRRLAGRLHDAGRSA